MNPNTSIKPEEIPNNPIKGKPLTNSKLKLIFFI
jgi:hypothetical protein